MTALVLNYVQNPFKVLLDKAMHYAEVIGYARATAELVRLGLYEEAKTCAAQLNAIKANNK